jgi:microcystin-dependent protein
MRKFFIPVICMVLCFNAITFSSASAEPFTGEIRIFAGNFAPRAWAFCDGQLLAISQNTALFSLLGTTYGGDGRTTFGLPDLRGRVPMHAGTGPGLTTRLPGQTGGQEQVTLIESQIPAHTHQAKASSEVPDTNSPEDAVSAQKVRTHLYNTGLSDVNMGTTAISSTGGSQAHDNMQPYQCLNYIICLQGLYPSRN